MIDFTSFDWNSVILVVVAAAITFLLRAIPFIIFSGGREMPKPVKKVADLLPAAIMGVLVLYCIKGDVIGVMSGTYYSAIATAVALIAVVLVHLWKRNTLISIAVGTVLYMVITRILVNYIK